MLRISRIQCALMATLLISATNVTLARDLPGLPTNVLYVQSNSTVPGGNAILGYSRSKDGSLQPLPGSPFLTQGTGWFTYNIGPFGGDGIFAVDRRRAILYAPNSGSDTIAAFSLFQSGKLFPIPGSPFKTAGNTPTAFALKQDHLIVVNNAGDPSQTSPQAVASYTVGTLSEGGAYTEKSYLTVTRPAADLPTQALSIKGTPFVLTNELFGGTISSYLQDATGRLQLIGSVTPPAQAGDTYPADPLGLGINPKAPYVYAGLPFVNRVAVYHYTSSGSLAFVREVANSGNAVCWFIVTRDGRRMYTVNTGDNSISLYNLADPSNPVEIARFALRDGAGGTFQFALSPDESFIYALDEENLPNAAGKSNQIHILTVNHRTGYLTEIPLSPLKLPVPAGNRPQGLVVF